MKDISRKEFERARPSRDASETIQYCIDALDADGDKSIADYVCSHLTYEELLGAIMQADDSESCRISALMIAEAMPRYDVGYGDDGGGHVYESNYARPDGEWVKWSDVEKVIEALCGK